jgi:hypothetical protein
LGSPSTLGITEASFGELLRRIHLYKPTFTPKDLNSFPKTGKGLVYLPKKHFVNIIFRDLHEYSRDTDDFANIAMKEQPVNVVPNNTTETPDDLAIPEMDLIAVIEQHHCSDDVDDVSDTRSVCSEDDDDGNIADDESDADENEVTEFIENDAIIKEVLVIGDVDGIDQQIKLIEENNKLIQEMAYLGIENVLVGKNPGLIDHRSYENVLKTMMVLNNSVLSGYFVDKLFTKTNNLQVSIWFRKFIKMPT